MTDGPVPRAEAVFQVQQLGAGFIPSGNWYWCRIGTDGYPSEVIDTNGPFGTAEEAYADGTRITGGKGTNG
jgi:hypothetical protein